MLPRLTLMLAVVGIAAGCSGGLAGDPAVQNWEIRPVVDRSDVPWGAVYLDPGAVVVSGGEVHMFYNAAHDWPAPGTVGHATSTDGVRWEAHAPNGVFDGRELPWRGISVFASDAIVLDDGTWAIYFHTIERIQSTAGARIGMAVAPGPTGPWTVLDTPVLEPRTGWDAAAVLHPSVVRVRGGFRMYYDGHADVSGADTGRAIGVAVSADGYTWERAGPVLVAEPGEWTAAGVHDPNVEFVGNAYIMAFWASRPDPDRGGTDELLGVATSADGLVWERVPDPVMSSTTYGIADVLLSSTVVADGEFTVYFDAIVPAWSSSVWMARAPRDLLPTG